MHYYRAQGALLSDSANRPGVDRVAQRMKTAERLNTISFEEALRGSVLIGTPDDVVPLHSDFDRLKMPRI
jgi:hypothetical protein